jgi:GxxExxY protein
MQEGRKGGNMLEHEELTERIIQAASAVHRQLGPGFLESIYEAALSIELRKRGLTFDRQRHLPIFYDGIEIGYHRLDLLVEDTIVVELKAVKSIEDVHFAVVRAYLKAAGRKHGLLFNFALPKLLIKRVISA